MRLLSGLLNRMVQKGTLRLYDVRGQLHIYGGGPQGPSVTARIHDPNLYSSLLFNPELVIGEAYMDGSITFEDDTGIHDLLHLFAVNGEGLAAHPGHRIMRGVWQATRRLQQRNPLKKAAANAAHHYDIGADLYRLFLDKDLNYSCAFFEDPQNDTLERAQHNKLRRMAAKLQLRPGMRVADIGCGWGSAALFLARNYGVHVTGISPAGQQIEVAQARARSARLTSRLDFRQCDYRELEGSYDRIVSIGMMEHVGAGYFDTFFSTVRERLTPEGFAFIHCIGRMSPPGVTAPFMRKYIFPGGYVPALSEVFAATERQRLWVADMEVLRLHYYYTLRHWRQRFTARRAEAAALHGERFCRMWEFYLSAAELGFLHGTNMVFQILVSPRADAVPIQRDYMSDDARAPLAPPVRKSGGAKARKSAGTQAKKLLKRAAARKAGGKAERAAA